MALNQCECGCGELVVKRFKRGHNAKRWKGGDRSTRVNPTYVSWNKMLQRCSNPNHDRWSRYGGRGVAVYEKWRSFDGFLTDMGPRPGTDYCLSRIDHERDYEPGNVEWAPKSENNREGCERNRLWEASPFWQRRAV